MEMPIPVNTSHLETNRSAFLHWDGLPIDSISERSSIYCSLVQMVKNEEALDPSLEDKAVSFFNLVKPDTANDVDSFVSGIVPSSLPESSRDFVGSIVELISGHSKPVLNTAMAFVGRIVFRSSDNTILKLVKDGLIQKLISCLDLFSLSFIDAEYIHTSLLSIIYESLWISTERKETLKLNDANEQLNIRETVHNQVLLPSEAYIRHLCSNSYSFRNRDQSFQYMILLPRLLDVSPYHPATMEFVQNLHVCVTLTSAMAFFDFNVAICGSLLVLTTTQLTRRNASGQVLERHHILFRSLKMEGIEDIIEQWLKNDIGGDNGQEIATTDIKWNNMLGMNVKKLE
ncbi:hypothetical protein BLNAU_18565 [Blattamonas nauphoetae]|uniref:Uncharacterized protein n=1 Tax=Blattamonas nauphoetae TaxID=2049346 RepID=A0ABQ9X403_9EUKA|nr:hypothetical protein BLNAU_18565 [Blattamonas nauphoetae]